MKTFKEWVKLEEAKHVPGDLIRRKRKSFEQLPSDLNRVRAQVLEPLISNEPKTSVNN